jgi:SET domain-containing protein
MAGLNPKTEVARGGDAASPATPAFRLKQTLGDETDAVICETELIPFRRSRIHSTGGYTRADLAAGTRLIEYVGDKITKAESLRRCEADNEYIFTLDDEHDIDGNVSWNPARFINHSCAPNCEAALEAGRVWIVALRDIAAGEELTFDYGYDLVDYREHPCRCRAPECVDYIVAEEFFEHVRRQNTLALWDCPLSA